jgi:DNA-directed RNA polymerase subunit M/transcription elongation factor TFIIS
MSAAKNESSTEGAPSTVGLGGRSWIDEEVLRRAIMTPEQQQVAERGICPKCNGKLRRLSAAEGMTFNACEKCGDIWILTSNVEVRGR